MIKKLTRFVDSDFGYFNQKVEFKVDVANNLVTFYLYDNHNSKLVLRMRIPDNAQYMSVSEWRGYFISHLEGVLSKVNSRYDDYEVFLSQIKFKHAFEEFEDSIRGKIQQEKVLS